MEQYCENTTCYQLQKATLRTRLTVLQETLLKKHSLKLSRAWKHTYQDVHRAEQSRAEQSRAEQSRAEQSRAEQSRAQVQLAAISNSVYKTTCTVLDASANFSIAHGHGNVKTRNAGILSKKRCRTSKELTGQQNVKPHLLQCRRQPQKDAGR